MCIRDSSIARKSCQMPQIGALPLFYVPPHVLQAQFDPQVCTGQLALHVREDTHLTLRVVDASHAAVYEDPVLVVALLGELPDLAP
eukprot:10697070-Lingulodinium_polyedra.AAC.1